MSEAEVIRQALEREAHFKVTPGRSGAASWSEILRFVHVRWDTATPASKPVEWVRQELYGERDRVGSEKVMVRHAFFLDRYQCASLSL